MEPVDKLKSRWQSKRATFKPQAHLCSNFARLSIYSALQLLLRQKAVLSHFIQYKNELRATCSDMVPQEESYCQSEISERDSGATGHYCGETWCIPCFAVMIWTTPKFLLKKPALPARHPRRWQTYSGWCSQVLHSNIKVDCKMFFSVRNLHMNGQAT